MLLYKPLLLSLAENTEKNRYSFNMIQPETNRVNQNLINSLK